MVTQSEQVHVHNGTAQHDDLLLQQKPVLPKTATIRADPSIA